MSDFVLPEMLSTLLRGTIFTTISHFDNIGSTNDTAMHAASEGAVEGSVFLAEQQTAGRGRGNREWHSAQSTGIYCSVVLRPHLPPSEILILSLAVGLAVYDAVRHITPALVPDLKWPNDVLIHGKKVCGILAEMNAEITRVRYIVVGIGLNVNQIDFPPELQPIATSLRIESGAECCRLEVCAALLKSLDQEYRQLAEDHAARASILRRFQEQSSMLSGKEIEIRNDDESFRGITEGLDDRGFLRVRTPQGLRTILSGSVKML